MCGTSEVHICRPNWYDPSFNKHSCVLGGLKDFWGELTLLLDVYFFHHYQKLVPLLKTVHITLSGHHTAVNLQLLVSLNHLRTFVAFVSSRLWAVTQQQQQLSAGPLADVAFLCHDSTQQHHSFMPFTLKSTGIHANMCPVHLICIPALSLLTHTVHSTAAAAAQLLLLPGQDKYHSFIWSCAAPWGEALTLVWASSSTTAPPPPLCPIHSKLPLPGWGQEY